MPRLAPPILIALTCASLLVGCADNTTSSTTADSKNLAHVKIPEKVKAETSITVGAPDTQVALKLSGQLDKLPFKVKWANISGGPQCSEAFRAHSLDLCSAAEIPSIHAHWTGLDTKLVATEFRKDPLKHPVYELGIAPGADVDTLADLRGKKIAYSPGQAQGRSCCGCWPRRGSRRAMCNWSSCPARGMCTRPRSAAAKWTSRPSEASTSSAIPRSTARTAGRPSSTGCVTIPHICGR
ncbi:hypothetical protein ACFQ10_49200 [Streptomyces indonesiensis]